MPLIDTHTHLESFVRSGTLPGTLARARTADVKALIAIGTGPDDWSLYRDLAHDHVGLIHYSVGLHPCSVNAEWEEALAQVEDFWRGPQRFSERNSSSQIRNEKADTGGRSEQPKPVALGEIGLDRFHLPKSTAEGEKVFAWQRAAFGEGLAIAKRLNCPVVIHSRGAFRECVEMIDASGVDWSKVVFHCFAEGETEMGELMERGGYGSFTGILTYKNAENVRAAAKTQGIARLMLETDAPYLTPMPHRGKPNEPAFVRHTAEFAATEVFGVSYDELAATTTATAQHFFGV